MLQQLVNGLILGSVYALLGPWLYHGVWNYQIDQLCPWGYLHGRCLYGIFLIELVESELLLSLYS